MRNRFMSKKTLAEQFHAKRTTAFNEAFWNTFLLELENAIRTIPKGEKGDTGEEGARGEQGPQGRPGDETSLRNNGTHIQYRIGAGPWFDLIDISDLLGPQGDRGEKGDPGEPFKIGASGTIADRDQYDAEEEGFTFLDEVNSRLYLRRSTPGEWSAAIPFGRGEQGEKGDTGEQGPVGPPGTTKYDELEGKPEIYTRAEIDELLQGYAKLSGATFTGGIRVEGDITGTGNVEGYQA
ncbi:hypothetical protein [Brucella intermedia]|nr:hypothetical protein [Brucella intermedia]